MSRIVQGSTAHELGAEYGRELAAAFLLAIRKGATGRTLQRQMGQIVVREISIAVDRLRLAAQPASVVAAYEAACRTACRDVLLASRARDRRPVQAAA